LPPDTDIPMLTSVSPKLPLTFISACLLLAVSCARTGSIEATSACALTVEASLTGQDHVIPLSVAASGPGDVWVLSSLFAGGRGTPRAQHWDGRVWTTVSMQEGLPNHGFVEPQDVSVLSPSDAWMVGSDTGKTTVTSHWDGARWEGVPSLNGPTADENQLLGVAVVGPTDVWAAGIYRTDGELRTLIEHWDGTAWQIVASPSVGPYSNALKDLAAVGPGDVWAVGWRVDEHGVYRTLIEHWDGAAWRVVPSPNAPSGDSILAGVAAIGPDDVWAVGRSGGIDRARSLVLHWDGSRWSTVDAPSPGVMRSELTAVAAMARGAVAVGNADDATGHFHPMAIRWNGSSWSVLPAGSPGGGGRLSGVAVPGPVDVWSVGTSVGGLTGSLVEHGCS